MARFTFVTWDGGGNLPPAIGIAQELVSRGHAVRFLGYEVQRPALAARGFQLRALPRSGSFDIYGDIPPEERLGALTRMVWANPDHLADLDECLAAEPADVLVIDFVMNGALAHAARSTVPAASLAHSSVAALIPPPGTPMGDLRLAATNALRRQADLPILARLNDGWEGMPTLVTTIPELDPSAAGAPSWVHYVGPIRERSTGEAFESPWDLDDGRPLVLVSFSTTGLWDQRERIRKVLEALAEEPLRVLVSSRTRDLGPAPANAAVRPFVPHELVMPWSAVTITHCGHGTVTASLASGVPILGLPNAAADQPFLAARLEDLGAGLALDGGAGPSAIRMAVRKIIGNPSYRTVARKLGLSIRATGGAHQAATELERLAH